MFKKKKELNPPKEDIVAIDSNCTELGDNELTQITGGGRIEQKPYTEVNPETDYCGHFTQKAGKSETTLCKNCMYFGPQDSDCNYYGNR